jgi:DNA-binding Xre family transcriptional regulator
MRIKRDTSALKKREEIEELRRKLAEAEQTLQAIRDGEVDAMVVSSKGLGLSNGKRGK